MPDPRPIQITFNSVNPSTPAHAIADDECATATNVDFGLGQGALRPRRGSTMFGTVGTASIGQIFRNNNVVNDAFGGKFYVTDGDGTVYRGTGSSWVTIQTGMQPGLNGMNAFGTYALIGGQGKTIKDDGTTTTEWIKQVPSVPTITVNTLAPISYSTSSYTVYEGSQQGTDTSTITVAANSDGRMSVGIQLVAGTATAGKDLTVNGSSTIGDYGVNFVSLAFDNPSVVQYISQDWSVGDATFANYLHAELYPQNAIVQLVAGQPAMPSAQPDPNTLIDSNNITSDGVDTASREQMLSTIRAYNGTSAAVVTQLANVLSPWAVARTDFSFVGQLTGTAGTDPWSNIYGVRYTVVMDATSTCTVANAAIFGAEDFPLTDVNNGYQYWQTFATLDTSSNKIGESAASPASSTVVLQNANTTVAQTGTATGTAHGINAVITYRQGGYMANAYAVSTITYGSALATFTDTMNDIQALTNDFAMARNISPPTFFGDFACIAPPWNERVFFAQGGFPIVQWSLPGQLDSFPITSTARVSHDGDATQALVAWPPGLIIVNLYSVYEMTGSDFENGVWSLQRSGSRHGSISPRVPIATPYGIPLLNFDGLSLYQPGQGSDQEIDWLNQKYGDMFRFSGATDPAAQDGSRIPGLNSSYLNLAISCYAGNRLMLAAATGTSSLANTVYILDFPQRRCWWYTYTFGITSLYWDEQSSQVLAGTVDGKIMRIETGDFDTDSNGTTHAITWSARTKRFSVPSDTLLENVFVECKVPNGTVALTASFDGVGASVASFNNTTMQWENAPLSGTFANALEFTLVGSNEGPAFVNQIKFDLLPEPYRARYFRTPYDEHEWAADKLWDVAYFDIAARTGTGTITAVTFIDNVAVMTNVVVGPTGRCVTEAAFPLETYGRVAYTVYNADVDFQVFDTHYDARNEPAKINDFRSDTVSLEETICDALDCDINPNGTVTATVYIDNVAIQTSSFVGATRQSFTVALPREQYGRTLFAYFTGAGFKLYRSWWHQRPEPDRWLNFVAPKQSGDEHEWKVFKPEVNPLGGTVLATVTNEGTAIGTYTLTGSERLQYTFSLPVRVFGRTIWAGYSAASVFKHYTTEFEGDVEPPRVTQYRTGPYPFPSSHYLKTWLPLLDPRAGTVTGTLIVDDSVLTTIQFTGDRRQWFTVGLDIDTTTNNALETGSRWECIYSAAAPFKHYETKLESEAKPFGKKVWAYSYRKQGGASQLDMPRFLAFDAESSGTATVTYFVDIDSVAFATGTLTLTGGPQWIDRISLPPGGRGRLFEFRLQCGANTVKVQKATLDFMQEGVKGLTRREEDGTPAQQVGL